MNDVPVNEELARCVLAGVRLRFRVEPRVLVARVAELLRAAGHESPAAMQANVSRLLLDDLYLATACLAGEEAAWQELAKAHFEFMRDFARRFAPPGAAREVADEVIADLWERGKLRQYGGRSTLRTWLGTVVTHAALNSRQSASRTQPLQAEGADTREASVVDPAAHESAQWIARLLADALRALPARERLLLYLYYEQEMTLDELGMILRASAPAISRRLKSTRETLRAAIESASRRAPGESADSLRDGLDLSQIELDLDKLLGGSLSKYRKES